MVLNAVLNSISVISQRPVHLSMLSWSCFNQYSAQNSFQSTDCLPTYPLSKQRTAVTEEWLIDWMVFYATFNSISVISRRQLTLFMSFLSFTSTRLGSEVPCPRTLLRKSPEDPVRLESRTPGLWVKHFTTEPRGTRERNESCRNDFRQSSERILAEPEIEPATSCFQVCNATDWAKGLGTYRNGYYAIEWRYSLSIYISS